MGNIIIIIVLVVIIGMAVYGTMRRMRYGSSCCGEHEPTERRVKVQDKNRENYPFVYILKIDGMHCSNCARRIENAFNKEGTRWATADIGKKQVSLLSKKEETETDLRTVVASAGYTLLSVKRGAE